MTIQTLTQTPYKKRNLSALPTLAFQENPTEYQYLSQDGLRIINELIKYYRDYDGDHWINEITGANLEPKDLQTANGLDYAPTLLTINLVAWFIDKLAAFMFERPILVSCPPRQEDSAEERVKPDYQPSEQQKKANAEAAAREQLIYKIQKKNKFHRKLLTAAKDYFVGGGVCIKLWMSEERGLRLIPRPRLEYWPIYDADDIDQLIAIHFVAWVSDDTLWKQTFRLSPSKEAVKDDKGNVTEPAGPTTCWMEEGYYDTALKLKEGMPRIKSTDIGLPFIPVVIFNRGGLTGETEGRSLVKVLRDLNRELEKKISDNADSLRFGMFAIKVLLNATLPSKKDIEAGTAEPLSLSPNALWAMQGADGENPPNVKSLESEFKYREALKEHLETLVSLMHKLADVPNIDPEQIKGLGQLSGFAITLMFGAIISATNQNMVTWGEGLQELFGKALYMLGKFDASKHYDEQLLKDANVEDLDPFNLEDLIEVTNQMPVPKNEVELVEMHTKRVAALLESVKDAMKALGVEDPETKLAEILSEKKGIEEAMGGPLDGEPNTKDRTGTSGIKQKAQDLIDRGRKMMDQGRTAKDDAMVKEGQKMMDEGQAMLEQMTGGGGGN